MSAAADALLSGSADVAAAAQSEVAASSAAIHAAGADSTTHSALLCNRFAQLLSH